MCILLKQQKKFQKKTRNHYKDLSKRKRNEAREYRRKRCKDLSEKGRQILQKREKAINIQEK